MKKILVLLIFFSFFSCEIQYDGEIKLQVSGKLIDKSGNTLTGKKIDVFIRETGRSFTSSYIEDLISFGISDNNGLFTFLIPTPINDNDILVKLSGSGFLDKTISFKKNNFNNYKIDFQNITLTNKSEVTNLKLILNKISTNKEILDITIEALQYQKILDLNNNQLVIQFDDFLSYAVFKNQTVVLKYTIRENGINTNFSENVLIENDAIIKTITY